MDRLVIRCVATLCLLGVPALAVGQGPIIVTEVKELSAPPPNHPAVSSHTAPTEENESDETFGRLRIGGIVRQDMGSREQSSGIQQMLRLRSENAPTTFGFGLEIDLDVGTWLRAGVGLGYERTSSNADEVAGIDYLLESVYGELSLTPTMNLVDRRRFLFTAGLRISAGGGYTNWRLKEVGESGAHFRLGAGIDLGLSFRDFGLGLRFGYTFQRTGGLGAADLEFDLSGLEFTIGFLTRF